MMGLLLGPPRVEGSSGCPDPSQRPPASQAALTRSGGAWDTLRRSYQCLGRRHAEHYRPVVRGPHRPAEARDHPGHHRGDGEDREDHRRPGPHRLPGRGEVQLGVQRQARERHVGGAMLYLRGITPATVLPLTPDPQMDEPELRRYIRWIAGQGIKAVAVNVDTGEGPHLWHDEKLRVLRVYKEELAGRDIPIVAGLGASFTAQAVKYAKEYREAGPDGFLVFPITAYLGQPLDPEVPYRYHRAIAEAVGMP